jgi:hypothetical protein
MWVPIGAFVVLVASMLVMLAELVRPKAGRGE